MFSTFDTVGSRIFTSGTFVVTSDTGVSVIEETIWADTFWGVDSDSTTDITNFFSRTGKTLWGTSSTEPVTYFIPETVLTMTLWSSNSERVVSTQVTFVFL